MSSFNNVVNALQNISVNDHLKYKAPEALLGYFKQLLKNCFVNGQLIVICFLLNHKSYYVVMQRMIDMEYNLTYSSKNIATNKIAIKTIIEKWLVSHSTSINLLLPYNFPGHQRIELERLKFEVYNLGSCIKAKGFVNNYLIPNIKDHSMENIEYHTY